MRAIQIDHYGGPEVIIRRELPVPNPRPGEWLIRLAYSGINFMDIHTRQGEYAGSRTYPQTMPTTLGTDFRVGDKVAYCLSWGAGSWPCRVAKWRLWPCAVSAEVCCARGGLGR